ncbi:RNA-directed DNA polymerase [Vitreoscilla filiformis]|uniref:CRISPR-associated endonuclease Cas1 n=2 Tax=Vitreoscilla filiformis TaxID=63 RepID=A0A221KG05_VITFI|nr:RNA-directed DNA polymerase [Vitreoscilla filiformis]
MGHMHTASFLDLALSEQNLLQAWDHVRTNAGAPGSDGETIQNFSRHILHHLQQLKTELLSGQYRPQPLRYVPIPKKNGGTRTLAIPTVRDRILQTSVAHVMSQFLDPQLDAASYAYRPGRSVSQAIACVLSCRDAGLQWVLDADIEQFFDHIDHEILNTQLESYFPNDPVCQMVAAWIANGSPEPHAGVPQGSPLSPLLANVYLHPLDRQLRQEHQTLIRYADDFVVLCADENQARQAWATVQQILADLKLRLQLEKTHLTTFDQGFNFLGVHFHRHTAQPLHPHAAPWVLPSDTPPDDPASGPPDVPRWLESIDPALSCDDTPASDEPPATPPAALEPRAPLLQSLYVTEPGCWLTQEHDRVVVSHQHTVRASVPLGQVDQVAILSNAMVSTALLRRCAQRRVSVVMGGWGTELLTLDRGALADHALWQAQWDLQAEPERGLMLARCLVAGKLHNSCTILRRFSRREGREAVEPLVQSMLQDERKLAAAERLEVIRGLEGAAARAYFAALRGLLPPGVDFPGRQRHPPPDPVNACLSLGYGVLAHNLHTLIRLEGLNAHLGHLHVATPGSLALVSDLMEEFRAPVVDAVVLTLWREGRLQASDFECRLGDDAEGWPCRMVSAARKRLVDALEEKLESHMVHPRLERLLDLRRIMQAQVRHYRSVVMGEVGVYHPFKLR